jgi:HPt (histidine-containing phosphotransfer) domain-containing protein
MADVVYVNFEEGSKRVMNNTKLYIKLLTKFRTENNLNELSQALSAGDMEKAQAAVHTIKGLAANLSLTELFEQARNFESRIKEQNVPAGGFDIVQNAFNETLKEVDKVIAEHG